jgi:hypothetical protein
VNEKWPAPSAQSAIPGQADYHQVGATGMRGIDGQIGNAGRSLRWVVTTMIMRGSLWILTDGGAGGPGGAGGKGQLGGADRCDGEGRSNGGDGGRGGRGGDGGRGGSTSNVRIEIGTLPVGFVLTPAAIANGCVKPPGLPGSLPTPPPSSWTEGADDGRIVVWGRPGCGGVNPPGDPFANDGGFGGQGGAGGGTGLQCYSPPFVNYYTHPGKAGMWGDLGSAGQKGGSGSVEIVGPSAR